MPLEAAPARRQTPELKPVRLRRHSRLGKYRILKRLDHGAFAVVFAARDEVQGIDVALKVPRFAHPKLVSELRREVKLANRLNHPNVLRVWNADLIDGHFLIAYELGTESLADRMRRAILAPVAMGYSEQILEALKHAHARRIMHLDVKPENIILFPNGSVRLGDFGISRVVARTRASFMSAAGTLGYMAPEQAYGKPTQASDVFSAGLIIYRLLAGQLPEWPFRWPFPGQTRLKQRVNQEVIQVIRRATAFDPEARYADAGAFCDAFTRAAGKLKRRRQARRKRRTQEATVKWREIREREFRRRYGQAIGPFFDCYDCGGPVVEAMLACPWCGAGDHSFAEVTRYKRVCPRCERGMAADWRFCPWCYGAGFDNVTPRRSRPQATVHCRAGGCRGPLPVYARYCPWCRHKVRRRWVAAGFGERCTSCDSEVARDFWEHCPWCRAAL